MSSSKNNDNNSSITNKKSSGDKMIKATETSKRSSKKPAKLPSSWAPAKFDIICGRGSIAQQHEGNQRLKALVQSMLPEYNASKCKFQKSKLVSSIVETIQQSSPDGGFVKFVDDGWVRVTERHCREKVGQLFRDALHTKYKSSTKAKSKIRRQSNLKSAADGSGSVDNNSTGGDSPDSSVASHNEPSSALHHILQRQPAQPLPIPSSITCLQRPLQLESQQTQQQAAPPSPILSHKLKLPSPCGSSSSSSASGSYGILPSSNNTISLLALNDLQQPAPVAAVSASNDLFGDLDFQFLHNDPGTFLSKISDENIDQVCDYIYDQL